MNDLLEMSKEYLRIDGNYDDEMLQILIESAKQYMSNAGVKEQENDLYNLAIMMLVTNWYENREQVTGSIPKSINLGLQSIILQLKVGNLNESS